jgi:peptidoglycan biosynthesis protein MviN/MurJ (putative lipid II flippase)
VLACAVPGWVVQQVAVRGFYARGEMWRAMALSTAIALGVFPLYLWGGSSGGVRGLAMASAAAITLNAIVTIVWLRRRCGAPALGTLAGTFARTALIALIAALATRLALDRLPALQDRPWLALLAGTAVYGGATAVVVPWLADAPVRRALHDLVRRLRRRPPAAAREAER